MYTVKQIDLTYGHQRLTLDIARRVEKSVKTMPG